MDVRHRRLLVVLQHEGLPSKRRADLHQSESHEPSNYDYAFVIPNLVLSQLHETTACPGLKPERSDTTRSKRYRGYKPTGHKLPPYGLLLCAGAPGEAQENRPGK